MTAIPDPLPEAAAIAGAPPKAANIRPPLAADAPAAVTTAPTEAADVSDRGRRENGDETAEIVDESGATASPPHPIPTWEACLAQVRGHLRSMTAAESVNRSVELQALAQTEIARRANPGTVNQIYSSFEVAATGLTTACRAKKRRLADVQRPIANPGKNPLPMMKLRPPVPPRQDGADDPLGAELPMFCQLVNFPALKYCDKCVMCGSDEVNVPKQNKGVCNNCDTAIWVHNPTGLLLKWCKGAKNFRKWSEFGSKGHSTKTVRCREQQAHRYATQKGGAVAVAAATPKAEESARTHVVGDNAMEELTA